MKKTNPKLEMITDDDVTTIRQTGGRVMFTRETSYVRRVGREVLVLKRAQVRLRNGFRPRLVEVLIHRETPAETPPPCVAAVNLECDCPKCQGLET